MAAKFVTPRRQGAGTRLAFVIPLLPWPILFWIRSQDQYSLGRHYAEPLYAVSREATILCAATFILGLILILVFGKKPETMVLWFVLATLNAIVLWNFILKNAIAYA